MKRPEFLENTSGVSDSGIDGSHAFPDSLLKQLQERKSLGNLRKLNPNKKPIDFSSNDYLGFSSSGLLKRALLENKETFEHNEKDFFGSTGSRLLSGDSQYFHTLEDKIALFHNAESSLIYSSGYAANLGLVGCLPTRHDTVIYDELSHASLIDGAKFATAKNCWSYKHNDLKDLEDKISKASGTVYVITESVFSMDGDFAPLEEICEICQKTNSYLIVDEAHAAGLFGENGAGRVCELSLEDKVFARVLTFGKAMGCHGACVLGSKKLTEFLINFSRPFIFSTAPDFSLLQAINTSYDLLKSTNNNKAPLFFLVHEFRSIAKKECKENRFLDSLSPIQGILFNDNQSCLKASAALADVGIDARAILSPTVPKGKERIRICLHTTNSINEVQLLFHTLKINGFLL